MNSYYDSIVGPSMHISPEELDQLDHGLSHLSTTLQFPTQEDQENRPLPNHSHHQYPNQNFYNPNPPLSAPLGQTFKPFAMNSSGYPQTLPVPPTSANNPFYPRSNSHESDKPILQSSPIVLSRANNDDIMKPSAKYNNTNILTPPESDNQKQRSFIGNHLFIDRHVTN